MKIEKIEQMFALMKQYGVAHFKEDGVEIKFSDAVAPAPTVETQKAPAAVTTPKKPTIKVPLQAVPPVESQVPHHINEVANLLKLSDEELVDKLFPDYTQMPLKEAKDA